MCEDFLLKLRNKKKENTNFWNNVKFNEELFKTESTSLIF